MICKRKISLKQHLFNIIAVLLICSIAEASPVKFKSHGKGKAVILIPGLMSDESVWKNTISALKHKYQLHTLSISGFGKTKPTEPVSVKLVANQLAKYIDKNNLNSPVIVGHSLGGFLAYYMGIHYPNKVGKIISVDGLPYIAPIFTRNNNTQISDVITNAELLKNRYQNMSQEQMLFISKSTINIQAESKESQQKVLNMIGLSDPKTVGMFMYELMTTDLRADIQNIKKPILLLGASGGFNSQSEHQFAEQLYRQQFERASEAKIVMNTNSRHFIMFDDPKWLHNQLISFIGE